MTRFVELEQENDVVWVNPEHVVAVSPGREGGSWLLTEMGQRIKVLPPPASALEILEERDQKSLMSQNRRSRAFGEVQKFLDLTVSAESTEPITSEVLEQVRENLAR